MPKRLAGFVVALLFSVLLVGVGGSPAQAAGTAHVVGHVQTGDTAAPIVAGSVTIFVAATPYPV